MSIHKSDTKVKDFLHTKWGIAIGITLLLTSSHIAVFFGGIMIQLQEEKEEIIIEYPPLVPQKRIESTSYHAQGGDYMQTKQGKEEEGSMSQSHGRQYAASQNGTRYYTMDCAGLNRVLESNRIYFETEDDAIASGRSRAQGCNW